jgi:hypothetical protein
MVVIMGSTLETRVQEKYSPNQNPFIIISSTKSKPPTFRALGGQKSSDKNFKCGWGLGYKALNL